MIQNFLPDYLVLLLFSSFMKNTFFHQYFKIKNRRTSLRCRLIFLCFTYYYCFLVHTSTDTVMMCVQSYIEHLQYLICFLHHKNASVIIVTTSVDNTLCSASANIVLFDCGLTQKSLIFNVGNSKENELQLKYQIYHLSN